MSKRMQSFGIVCIVISMALCPFLSVSASTYGQPYTSSYMPVCPLYPTSSQLPFGEDTVVVCTEYLHSSSLLHRWFFLDTMDSVSGTIAGSNVWSFYFKKQSANPDVYADLYFESYSKILVCSEQTDGTITKSSYGTQDTYYGFFQYTYTGISYNYSRFKLICPESYLFRGLPLDAVYQSGALSESDIVTDKLFIASYPDTVQQAINSIDGNTNLLSQYYTSLNSKLNALSIDVSVVQGQNNELLTQVSQLQSQLNAQSGEYQSALATAQSQIESNAQSAAQSAADDVNNAGEDVSDIDTDMDDVNGIVETLDGWIEDLDGFADNIDESISGVADALDNASSVVTGFLGVCPPVVIALFGFALVFLVVRKIIGR